MLRKYLLRLGYGLHESVEADKHDIWEVRNCSITEVALGEKEPGEFLRLGASGHIMEYAITEYAKERLENSTG